MSKAKASEKYKQGIDKYILEVVVFVCGAVVMVFELVGSRVLGPYFGTSIVVWTGLIGIILGSLSLGYYWGGRIADRKPSIRSLAAIIFMAAILIAISTLSKDFILSFLLNFSTDIRISSFLASVCLFLPASFFLGMVSPYAAKLKLSSLKTSGATVGNLYALSTAWSIFGTFLSGFFLIPHYGTNKLLIILSATLIVVAVVLTVKKSYKPMLASVVVLVIGWLAVSKLDFSNEKKEFVDIDTEYNRVWIYDRKDAETGKLVKIMGINNENHSSMFLQSDELVSEYSKYFHLAQHFNPLFKKTLIIGGAGYSYPKNFLSTYSKATIDVVEIDPKVTQLAKAYFRLKDNSRMTIYHQDGRVYLNSTLKKYDVIFGDAFGSSYSLPYQLTTKEAVQKKYNILNNDGVVVLNIISAIDGKRGKFLRAEYATYKSVFSQVYLFPVREVKGNIVQNIILIALKSSKTPTFTNTDPELDAMLGHLWKKSVASDVPILTDDFAPVDYYTGI